MFYIGQVAYYNLNIDYIIENYCINKEKPELKCNGKCHLAKQLASVSKTNTSDDLVFNVVNSFYPVLYPIIYPDISFKLAFIEKKERDSFSYHENYFFSLINKHFKPPPIV